MSFIHRRFIACLLILTSFFALPSEAAEVSGDLPADLPTKFSMDLPADFPTDRPLTLDDFSDEQLSLLSEAERTALEQGVYYVRNMIPSIKGEWLPEFPKYFKPFLADPRNLSFSFGLRFHDDVLGKTMSTASFGNEFPILKWNDVWTEGSELQLGIGAGAWSVFDLNPSDDGDIVELINTDYYIGMPFTYTLGNIAYRFRLYHVSTHIGDEYIIANPTFERLNPSHEAADFFASWHPDDSLRLYGGLGRFLSTDSSFRQHPFYIEYGAEWRMFGRKLPYFKLLEQPFFAFHVRHMEDLHWQYDGTFRLGSEWSPIKRPNSYKMRVYLEYHDGFSVEGQFSKQKSKYMGLGISFGY
ncbi:Uncharacterized protein SCG7109_AK_00210 [Chlamydiales bacterium SCGC AG-110-M15]|nr:Uncharacterized protein SCG7109_AK_00210 [Chlamydiales bacterium SCGC AG-110-M15]